MPEGRGQCPPRPASPHVRQTEERPCSNNQPSTERPFNFGYCHRVFFVRMSIGTAASRCRHRAGPHVAEVASRVLGDLGPAHRADEGEGGLRPVGVSALGRVGLLLFSSGRPAAHLKGRRRRFKHHRLEQRLGDIPPGRATVRIECGGSLTFDETVELGLGDDGFIRRRCVAEPGLVSRRNVFQPSGRYITSRPTRTRSICIWSISRS